MLIFLHGEKKSFIINLKNYCNLCSARIIAVKDEPYNNNILSVLSLQNAKMSHCKPPVANDIYLMHVPHNFSMKNISILSVFGVGREGFRGILRIIREHTVVDPYNIYTYVAHKHN